jgi:hypothetical protein
VHREYLLVYWRWSSLTIRFRNYVFNDLWFVRIVCFLSSHDSMLDTKVIFGISSPLIGLASASTPC